PHGDHWHCDGPLVTSSAAPNPTGSSTKSLKPSPTESIGCEPHGDHWHCDGPRVTSTGTQHPTGSNTASLKPSPTESVGCEPHGDHWHCDGPRASGTAPPAQYTGAAGYVRVPLPQAVGAMVAMAAVVVYV
ncbi:hypothetical protein H109_05641, partial [Trichophyton interdigitale MR816]